MTEEGSESPLATEAAQTEGDGSNLLENETQAPPQEPDFCLEILPFIKEAQNQHGLRHGDYQRYRMYCSRRLRRIRKSLNFMQSHRNRFQKKPIKVEKVTDIRYLYILVVCAERSWAMAMELKQAANTEPRKRFHLLRRLNRAGKYAQELVELCEGCVRCDARTKLEVQAYHLWMSGNIEFEKQSWQEALDAYGQCQNIYQRLGGAVSEEQRPLYTQRVEEMSPSIRYCAYNIGDLPTDVNELQKLKSNAAGSDILASKIDLVLAKTQEKAASSLTEITWQGQKVPVRSEKVRVSLVKLQQVEGELLSGGDKIEVYERLLMECQDALQVAKEELSSEQALAEKKKSAKNEAQRSSLRLIIDYLSHVKLNHAVNRNLALIANLRDGERTAKPEEFVRVYDILLQHISELGEIPSLAEDHSKQKQNTARTFAFKAHRCYHLAESYVVMKKWPEAIALFDRAYDHVIQAIEQYRVLEHSGVEATKIDKSIPDLQKLQSTIRGKKCEVHVTSVLEEQNLEDKMADLSVSTKPLTERLDQFVLLPPSSKPLLAPIPPDYRPIPCKPLFFDLALNHIEMPSLEHRVEKKQGGFTGFMKGLIWGSS